MNSLITTLAMLFGFGTSQAVYANAEGMVVLDVRTAEEFKEVHVKDAILIDVLAADFREKVGKLDRTKPYKVYCRSGNRSGRAVDIMKSMGFTDVENAGSVAQAAKKLSRACEGPKTC
jgi:rhodanese-related sulfurtransferase